MKDKVLALLEKFDSLDKEIASTDPSDTAKMTSLGKERKRMEPLVQAAEEWLRMSNELESLDEMIKSQDESMAQLAKEEKTGLLERFENHEKELIKLLSPRDPKLDRNVIIEIRAG